MIQPRIKEVRSETVADLHSNEPLRASDGTAVRIVEGEACGPEVTFLVGDVELSCVQRAGELRISIVLSASLGSQVVDRSIQAAAIVAWRWANERQARDG